MPQSAIIWTTVVGIFTVIGTIIVGVYTAKSARATNRETSQLAGWKDLVTASRTEIKEMRQQMKEDEDRYEGQIQECKKRIDRLAVRVESSERREQVLVLWIRRAVAKMQEHNLPIDPLPPGVVDTEPRLFPRPPLRPKSQDKE